MKQLNIISILICLLFATSNQAQESNKLKFHSVSFGVGTYTPLTETFANSLGGLNWNADLAFEMNKYIFSLYVSTGIRNLIVEEESYSEINFTIGKEFFLNNWFAIEGHLGLGHFAYKYKPFSGHTLSEGYLGFPIRLKGNFYLNNHLAVGLNPNININTYYSVILSGNLIFQYIF